MKRICKLLTLALVLVLALAVLPRNVQAAEVVGSGKCGADLTWTLDSEGTLTISGTGTMFYYSSRSSVPWYNARTSIKKVILPDGITRISDYAFGGCKNLTEIVIPEGVTTLGTCAFDGCTGLESVTFPSTLSTWYGYTFRDCSSLTELVFPEGMTRIGGYAFDSCTSLKSVTFPSTLTDIGDNAFTKCTALEEVHISSLEYWCSLRLSIFNHPFQKSTKLVVDGKAITGEMVIPDSVTEIGNFTFWGLNGVETIRLPETVTKIGQNAFWQCEDLVSINIPASLREIGQEAFSGCTNLSGNLDLRNVTQIEYGAFQKCSSLGSVMLGGEVSMKYNVFTGSGVQTVVFADSAAPGTVVIPEETFQGCARLTDVTLGSSVGQIGYAAFEGCKALQSVSLGSGVKIIDSAAFKDCSGLTTVTGGSNLEQIGEEAFRDCGALTAFPFGKGLTSIGNSAFVSCSALTEAVIPDTVTSIGSAVFASCKGLTRVELPEGLTDISASLFYNCASLTAIELPKTVETIGHSAFEGCAALTEITIPQNVTVIENETFLKCSSLTEMVLPKGLTGIGEYAFAYTGIETITIPDSVTSLGKYAFSNAGLKSVVIGSGITAIENYTFEACAALTDVVFPEGLQEIKYGAFSKCSALRSVQLPDSVVTLGGNVFQGCTGLTHFEFPAGVSKISSYILEGCTNLYSVVIPSSVTEVLSHPFEKSGLKHVLFTGTQEQWKAVKIASYNTELKGATVHTDATGEELTDWQHHCSYIMVYCTVCQENHSRMYTTTRHDFNSETLLCKQCGIHSSWRYTLYLTGVNEPFAKLTGYIEGEEPVTELVVPSAVEGLPVLMLGDGVLMNKTGLEKVVLPDTIDSIPNKAFYGCTGLKEVVCPDVVWNIGDSAFYKCTSLENFDFPAATQWVGSYSFQGCTALKEVVLPENTASIGVDAFRDCTALTTLTLPSTVGVVGGNVLRNSGIETVYYSGTTEQWDKIQFYTPNTDLFNHLVFTRDGYTFRHYQNSSGKKVLEIHCDGEIPGYAVGEAPWHSVRQEVDMIVLSGATTQIGSMAFVGMTSLDGIYIDGQVTKIDDTAFTGCPNVSIHGEDGSYAHSYAQRLGLPFSSTCTGKRTTVKATCTEGGYTLLTCTVCANTWQEDETQPLGHNAVTVHGTAPKCTEPGLTDGLLCQRCKLTIQEQQVIPAAGHTASEEPARAPTCTQEGFNGTGYCTVCYEVLKGETLPVDPDAHTYESAVTPPTQTEQGYTTYTCTGCGYSYVGDYTDPVTHELELQGAKDATCTEAGYTGDQVCTKCGETVTQGEVIPALGHEEIVEEAEEATCTQSGLTEGIYCDRCGEVLTAQQIIPALGHSWDEGVVTVEPTEEAEGSKTYTCTACGETKTEAIPALKHEHVYEYSRVEPTCTQEGAELLTCGCGEQVVYSTTPALGHSHGDWFIEQEPVNGVGKKYRVCETCGETEHGTFEMPLTDVPNGKYYSKPVFWAYENGITKGKTSTEFQRDADCTRKQIVMFLWRAAGQPEPRSMENPFVDVKADQFQKAILWAYYEGITSGKTATEFQPEAPCTREQIVMFLWRYFGKPEPQSMVNPFTDVRNGGTFEKAILWAYYEGITTGKTSTTFEPKATCTRGQIVTFLYRAMVE